MDDLFEVHYWPHTGRVMTVFIGDDILVTDARLVGTGGRGSQHLADLTAALAEHLASNGNPQGALAEHTSDGAVTYLLDAPAGADDGQDLTFRLAATGITVPAPVLTLANAGPLADGGRRATLLRGGIPLGAVVQPAGDDRPTFQPANPARRDQLLAELADFARTCRDRDGLPVTLSVLLAALLDEQPASTPARRRPRTAREPR